MEQGKIAKFFHFCLKTYSTETAPVGTSRTFICLVRIGSDVGYSVKASAAMPSLPKLNAKELSAVMWAQRLQVGVAGLKEAAKAITGIDLPAKFSTALTDVIEKDEVRRQALSKRPAAAKQTGAANRSSEPGEVFQIDGRGPDGAKQYVGVCEATGFPILRDTNGLTIDDAEAFCHHVVAEANAHGRTVKVFKFDRGSEFRSEDLEARLNKNHKCKVIVAPRNWHEGVAMAEVMNQLIDTSVDQMVGRVKAKQAETRQAAHYAAYLIGLQPRTGETVSRRQRFTRLSRAGLFAHSQV